MAHIKANLKANIYRRGSGWDLEIWVEGCVLVHSCWFASLEKAQARARELGINYACAA